MPIMAARMDVCKQKGFDAIDPDNTDGWSQQTGFPITKAHQVTYQRALADAAHARGLAVGLKNNVEQLSAMASFVDFAVNEECNEYSECGAYTSFLASGKPVYNIEYRNTCPTNLPAGMSSFISDYDLGRGGTICAGTPVKSSASASAPTSPTSPTSKAPVSSAPASSVRAPLVQAPATLETVDEASDAEPVAQTTWRDRWSTWSRYDWWRHDRSSRPYDRYSYR